MTRPPYAAEFVAPMIEWVKRGGRRCELSLELGGLAQTIPDGAKSSGGMMDLQRRTQITQVSWHTKEFYDCHLADGRVVRVETRRHRRLYRNFWKFGEVLAEAGLLQETKFNSIDVKVFSASDVMSLCAKEFNRNPLASLAEEEERGKWM